MRQMDKNLNYSRTRIKETRIEETFGYEKHFHSPAFMQDKLSTLIGQLMKETGQKLFSYRPLSFFHPSLTAVGLPNYTSF